MSPHGVRRAAAARLIHRGLSCSARGTSSPWRKLSASSLLRGSLCGPHGDAGVSREAFEDHLEGREACLLAAFEQALALAADARERRLPGPGGLAGSGAGGAAGAARVLRSSSRRSRATSWSIPHRRARRCWLRRGEVLDRLAPVLDDERAPARGYPPPLTAQAVVSGALGVLHGRFQAGSRGRWSTSRPPDELHRAAVPRRSCGAQRAPSPRRRCLRGGASRVPPVPAAGSRQGRRPAALSSC